MDGDSESNSWDLRQPSVIGHTNGASAADHSGLPAACVLCQRSLSPDNEAGELEAISICGDCKFLFLEEFGTPTQDTHRRRTTRVQRTRRSSSESIEIFSSQQFSHMISLARQSQPTAPEHENQNADSDAIARYLHRTSSRTTPSESRRWRRVLSDTESDGVDSLYGESESNVSFSGYRYFQSESDAIFSTYGGDSDASVDGHSFLDTEIFTHPDAGSDLDSDTDIDPMHAGLNQWNSGEEEEDDDDDEEEEDNEWEEADANENAVESSEGPAQLQSSLGPQENNGLVNWRRQLHSPDFEGANRLRIRESRQTYIPNIFPNLEDPEVPPFARNSLDYLDARGFDDLLERLAEADNSRRGAPPTAVSFVNSLPRVVINEESEKQDSLACAICKDFISVGNVVNQLPCFHLYHPSCILPWLRARNSCPLCRYELPTDDKDYEERKRNTIRSLEIHEILQQEEGMSEDSSSDINDVAEADGACEFSRERTEEADFVSEEHATGSSGREGARGRWLFLAAAPIVGLVGIVLVLWLGNPLTERRGPPIGCRDFPGRRQHPNHSSGSWPPNQTENRSRRWWWSLF